jgi:hypothetical protein
MCRASEQLIPSTISEGGLNRISWNFTSGSANAYLSLGQLGSPLLPSFPKWLSWNLVDVKEFKQHHRVLFYKPAYRLEVISEILIDDVKQHSDCNQQYSKV